ncbi:MAG: hypothetical protein HY858_06135 [Candidatus Solibacter usitatus]|nr:hypothetical protein [Candidatus Solibacter usitatus]
MWSRIVAGIVLGGLMAGLAVWLVRPAPVPEVKVIVPAAPAPRLEAPSAAPAATEPAAIPVPAKKAASRGKVEVAKAVAEPVVAAAVVPPAAAAPVPQPEAAMEVRAAPAAVAQPAAKPVRQPQTATIPAGTLITVRLRDGLSSRSAQDGTNFSATLDHPLIVDGMVISERGTEQRGRVVEVARAGRVKGRSVLALELIELNTADGQKVDIRTEAVRKEEESGVKDDAKRAAVAAGIGAAIGAIFGGGKGAAIGAGAGGAAGAGAAVLTRGKDVELPSETRLTFRLKEPVVLTEKID